MEGVIVGVLALIFIAVINSFKSKAPPVQRTDETSRSCPEPPKPNRTRHKPFNRNTVRPAEPPRSIKEGAAYVVDGDTIIVQKTQIRLFGIDAPEMNHPYGRNAKWALVRLCKGQKVRAEILELDAHGRTVAKCSLPDGRDLSAEMVKLGLAIDWPKFSGGIYRSLETPDARKKMWLADARQKGRMHVWAAYEARQSSNSKSRS